MKRILVIRIDLLGDLVCTTALLHALKQRWPDAEVHVLVGWHCAAAVERSPDVSNVHIYVYSKKLHRNQRPGVFNAVLDRLNLIWRLRGLRFDMIIVPNGGMNKNSIQFARQLGVSDCRWHTADTEFDDRVAAHRERRPMQHEAFSGIRLVPELGEAALADLQLSVFPDPQLKAQWNARLGFKTRPRIGLFTSNRSRARRWPLRNWIELSEMLQSGAEVLIFSDPTEPEVCLQSPESPARWLSTPSTSELIAAMCLLDLVVSSDSAPVHLGAALKIPVVALFEERPEKYLRWYPLGVAHQVLYAGERVENIAVDRVRAAITSLLQSR